MDTDINDIWDLPVETSVPRPPAHTLNSEGLPPHASTRSRPLFLPSDDEQDAPATARSDANKNPDVDALFEGLEDMDDGFQDLAPALDLDALRREADARNARAVRAEISAHIPAIAELSAGAKPNGGKGGPLVLDGLDGDGEDGGKKKRKPVPRLDEARLLGKNGFPQLIEDMKNFKPKGKGHEATDLDRVLQVYQFWAHKLYPRTRFKETIDRVEKLCHSKRMQVARSVWHDEAHGLVNGVRLPPADNDNELDADSDADDTPRGEEAVAVAADQVAVSDSEREGDGLSLSSGASRPPSSSPDRNEAAIELDALLEGEALRASSHIVPTGHAWKTSNDDAVAMDEDDGLWDALDTHAATSAPMTAPAPPAPDHDEDMWDIVHELEQESSNEAARRSNPVQASPAAVDTRLDDLDDLYL
ncbi:replication fork protection component Swi3-domain-containing protein [Russula compacta]|nr:replication fork protection component Swi3-domain-containing protein [Russula compacta]